MEESEKIKLKKKNISKLRKIYDGIPESKREIRDELIDKLAAVCVTLKECEEHLFAEGDVVPMTQGNYIIDRENPYSKIQDRAMKTHQSYIKQLEGLLPDEKTEAVGKAGEALAAFVAKGKG